MMTLVQLGVLQDRSAKYACSLDFGKFYSYIEEQTELLHSKLYQKGISLRKKSTKTQYRYLKICLCQMHTSTCFFLKEFCLASHFIFFTVKI